MKENIKKATEMVIEYFGCDEKTLTLETYDPNWGAGNLIRISLREQTEGNFFKFGRLNFYSVYFDKETGDLSSVSRT